MAVTQKIFFHKKQEPQSEMIAAPKFSSDMITGEILLDERYVVHAEGFAVQVG